MCMHAIFPANEIIRSASHQFDLSNIGLFVRLKISGGYALQ